MVSFALFLTALGPPAAAQPEAGNGFLVGIYADQTRSVTCVTGPPGDVFEQTAWVYVPNDRGLAYVTLRLEFPPNIDVGNRPVFHDLVSHVIFTDFADGTVEWNMLFNDCPSGWIRIFTQECEFLDDQMSTIGILGDRSLARDCTFVLNGVDVVNELSVNDPGCPAVPVATTSWGGLKGSYR